MGADADLLQFPPRPAVGVGETSSESGRFPSERRVKPFRFPVWYSSKVDSYLSIRKD